MPSYSGFFFAKAMYRDAVVEMSVNMYRSCETEEQHMPFRTRTPKAQFFHIEWKTLRKHLLTTSFDPILDDWDGKTLGNVVTRNC